MADTGLFCMCRIVGVRPLAGTREFPRSTCDLRHNCDVQNRALKGRANAIRRPLLYMRSEQRSLTAPVQDQHKWA